MKRSHNGGEQRESQSLTSNSVKTKTGKKEVMGLTVAIHYSVTTVKLELQTCYSVVMKNLEPLQFS